MAANPAAGGGESAAESRSKFVYQILLIVSVLINAALAVQAQVVSQRTAAINDQLTRLQIEKSRIDREIAQAQQAKMAAEKAKSDAEARAAEAQNKAALSFARLKYDIATFKTQLKAGKVVPFMENLKDFRLVDNPILHRLDRSMKAADGSPVLDDTITFLVVTNTGRLNAASLGATMASGTAVKLGDLPPQAALLLPIAYESAAKAGSTPPIVVSTVQFDSPSGHEEVPVPPPGTQTWIPTLRSVQGIGRASIQADDKHIDAVLPGH